MAKNRNLIKNNLYNFKLRSRSSFFIETYFILGAFLIETVISGFIAVDSPFSFLTVDFLEFFILIVTFLVFLFSTLALFFDSRRNARKIGNKVWNRNSKKMMWLFGLLMILLYIIEFYLLKTGEEAFIIPTFIISYGFLLMILNFSKTKALFVFSMASILIGLSSLFFPNYEFYGLLLLGVSHIVFGIISQKKETKNIAS